MTLFTRYLRLFGYFVRFSLSRSMEFRLDFYFRVVMDTVYYATNLAFYKILFLHFPNIGGWNEQQALIFVSTYLLIDAVYMTFFSNNMWWFPALINRGDLDYYLVRPVSTLFFVSLRDFAFNSFINLLMTLGITAWAFIHYSGSYSFFQFVLYAVFVVNGVVLMYLLHLLFLLVVFWTHSADGFRELSYSLTKVLERPDRIFRGWVRFVFTFLLPYGLIASFPSRLVLDSFDATILIQLVGVTLFFVLLILGLWRRGLRIYSSASS